VITIWIELELMEV